MALRNRELHARNDDAPSVVEDKTNVAFHISSNLIFDDTRKSQNARSRLNYF